MMTDGLTDMLAQQGDGLNWQKLLYLLFFLVFPALGGLGEWIRKRTRKNEEGAEADGVDYDVIKEDDGDIVLRPRKESSPAGTAPVPSPVPQAKPTAPPKPVVQKPATYSRPVAPPPPVKAASAPRPVQSRSSSKPSSPRRSKSSSRSYADPTRAAYRAESDSHEAMLRPILLDESDSEESPLSDSILADEKFDTQSLRRAIVLSEILSPPLALRQSNSGPWDPID